jgi:hypothetical protein
MTLFAWMLMMMAWAVWSAFAGDWLACVWALCAWGNGFVLDLDRRRHR